MEKKNTYYKRIMTLMTGTIISQSIPILISPFLTRIYTPEDFGIWGLYLAISSVFAVLSTLKFELAIMLPKEDQNAKEIVVLSIILSIFISLLIFINVLFFGEFISLIVGSPDFKNWLYFVPISTLLIGIFQTFNYWANRKKEYRLMSISKVHQAISTSAVNVAIGIFSFGAIGLIIGTIVGQLLGAIKLSLNAVFKDSIFKNIRFENILFIGKRYSQFPKIVVWSNLLNTLSVQLPIIALTTVFSTSIAGYYILANRVLSIPISILGSAIGQVFFQVSTSSLHNESNNLSQITLDAYKNMLKIGILPIAIIQAFGSDIFSLIFGVEWAIAGEYASYLSIWLLFVFVSSPLSFLFNILEKELVSLVFNIVIFIVRSISLAVGILVFNDAQITVIIFAISSGIIWLFQSIYILKMVDVPYLKSLEYTIKVTVSVLVFMNLFKLIIIN